MTGSMYAAVSGLKAHMSALNVIGHNVANVNTYAYKATRYTFDEALYTTSRNGSNGTDEQGGRNPTQIGYGASIGTIDIDTSTKNYSPTGKALDCMIDGDGFFMVGDKTKLGVTTQDMLQGMTLTRLGRFEFDANGYLVDGDGQVVYGFLRTVDGEGNLSVTPTLTPIRLPGYDLNQIDVTQRVMYPQQVTAESAAVAESGLPAYAAGAIKDDDALTTALYLQEQGTATQAQKNITRLQPDTVSIDGATGRISLITNDDQLVIVGYIALGKVDSPNGVTHTDGRYFKALDGAGRVKLTTMAGTAVQYTPPEDLEEGQSELAVEGAGDTELVTGGLESSGTDLAQEITNMIVIQRGYQANTRIVTVTDSMLEELVNMKRG